MADIDGPADGGLTRRRALRTLGLAAAAYLAPAALMVSGAEAQPYRRTDRRTRPRRTDRRRTRRRTFRVRTFRRRTDRPRRTNRRRRTYR